MGERNRPRTGAGARWPVVALAVVFVPLATGCVTVAEFRKLDREVQGMQRTRSTTGGAAPRERMADLGVEVDALTQRVSQLEGRLEVAEHTADQALREARAARSDAASAATGPTGTGPAGSGESAPTVGGSVSEEVQAYRVAYGAWRSGDTQGCIDQFRKFLQTYPDSAYADDSAYWMADCYFKHRDYKTAVLRFDDVVVRYPRGNKAADALYRQGEALLRMGPGYGKAAGKAFERVMKEYPDSARAPEAKKQLDILRSG